MRNATFETREKTHSVHTAHSTLPVHPVFSPGSIFPALTLSLVLGVAGCDPSSAPDSGPQPDPVDEDAGEASWRSLSPYFCPGGVCQANDWNAVAFVNDSVGYVAGANRTVSRTTDGGANWLPVKIDADGGYLSGLDFVSEKTGWAVGLNEAVYKTTDRGMTWVKVDSGRSDWDAYAVDFLDANTGWVARADSIRRTTDGGATWVSSPAESGGEIYALKFPDRQTGYALGQGRVLKTTDGGVTWTPLLANGAPMEASLRGMDFIDKNRGWVTHESGRTWRTTDGGVSWTKTQDSAIGSPSAHAWRHIVFTNANTGWLVGPDLLKTTDGGVTWVARPKQTRESIEDVRFLGATTGYATGRGDVILKTTDGGETWRQLTAGKPEALNAVYAVGKDSAWAVGRNEKILATTDGGKTWKAQFARPEEGSGILGDFVGIRFADSRTGWILGDLYDNSYRTTDGGRNWIPMAGGGLGMDFIDRNRGWINQNEDAGLFTSDGGATWGIRKGQTGERIDFADAQTGFAFGSGLSKTTDGGLTWAGIESAGGVTHGCFLDPLTGWVVGDSGKILKTTDGGTTWAAQASGTRRTLTYVDFVDSVNGMAAGDGVWMHTTDGGGNWSAFDTASAPWDLVLHMSSPKRAYAVSGGRTIYKYSVSAP